MDPVVLEPLFPDENRDFPAGSVHEVADGVYGVFVVLVPPIRSYQPTLVFWIESPFEALHNKVATVTVHVYKTQRLA